MAHAKEHDDKCSLSSTELAPPIPEEMTQRILEAAGLRPRTHEAAYLAAILAELRLIRLALERPAPVRAKRIKNNGVHLRPDDQSR